MIELYKLDEQLEFLNRLILISDEDDQENEELKKEITFQLESLQIQRNDKIKNIIRFIKNRIGLKDRIDLEINRLKKRKNSLENLISWMNSYLKNFLSDGEKWEAVEGRIRWRKSKSVDITNEALIPECYLRIKKVVEPNKILIKEDLEAGANIPGVALIEKNNMSIE